MSFSCRIRQCFCSSAIRFLHIRHFLHQQTISHMHKRFPEWVHCQVVWILGGSTLYPFSGWKKIKQRCISFVLGYRYLRMILWKIQPQFISIKHRILATYNINKKFNSDNLYVVNQYTKILACHGIVNIYLFGIIFISLDNLLLTTP